MDNTQLIYRSALLYAIELLTDSYTMSDAEKMKAIRTITDALKEEEENDG